MSRLSAWVGAGLARKGVAHEEIRTWMSKNPEISKCAERIVEIYASRVGMNLSAQGMLERELMARFGATTEGGDGDDWVQLANQTLDEWERRFPVKGPRMASISRRTGTVVEKRRAI